MVDAANPFNVMVPVAVLQLAGSVKLVVVITGVGFTTTTVLPGSDGQLPVAAVAITVYVPPAASVMFAIDGF